MTQDIISSDVSSDVREAAERLAQIVSLSEGYGISVLAVYQYLPKGQFYQDLTTVLASIPTIDSF